MVGSYDYILNDGEALDDKLIFLAADEATTVIRGGRILDGRGGSIDNGTIVITGERISAVYDGPPPPDALPPSPTRTIDAVGKTVLPGMVDAHIHFSGNATADTWKYHLWPSEGLKFIRAAFEYYHALMHGFTTVRGLGHGDAEHVYALRQAKLEGLIRGPRTLHSGWALSQTRGHGDVPHLPWEWVEHARPRSLFCDGIEECRVAVRRNFGEGADVIKVYTTDNRTGKPDFTVEELQVVVEEAHRRGKKVATHAKDYHGVRNALLAGIDTIEHGTAEVHADLLGMMRDQGTFLVPTMATVHRVGHEGNDWGIAPPAQERAKRELEGRQKVARAAAEMGIKIATGSDAGARAGYGLLSARELALLADSGLSSMQAVVAATGHGVDALGLSDDIGTIVPGMLGELLVVDGNPLTDIGLFQDPRHIHTILQSQDPLTF
jgi:imidazolonepropionase-like amidohydrolase